jgi:hypothetical protein
MASIEKRTRNGRVSYSVRYRDPAGRSRRKVFARKVDAARWLADNEAARNRVPGSIHPPAATGSASGPSGGSPPWPCGPGPAAPIACSWTTISSPPRRGSLGVDRPAGRP